MNTQPLALYLHLPWCVKKCPYCDFNSHTAGNNAPRDRYVEAVCKDIASEAARAAGRPLISIFIGGGTPSLFSGCEIGELLDAVRANFSVSADAEITMEANPGTVERHNLGGYREAGVNRLSLGAQSFNEASLQQLGRIHGPREISAAVADARQAGFSNFNLDLMFALPGQTLSMAAADLDAALALNPRHLSLYQLTLEPNTVFFRRPPANLPNDDQAAAMQEQAFERLSRAGFERYEVSAFATEGATCRHNINYWTYGDYLAVGAGAHGKITDVTGIWRYQKTAHPRAYMEECLAGSGEPASATAVDGGDRVFEFMLNALRMPAGFSEALLEERTGMPAADLRGQFLDLESRGLLEAPEAGKWRPTALGLRFLNALQAAFLPPAAAPRQGASG
ncbi:MAG: radical SAM family heme chaperone HemW [Woeseia sp.]|nr:radical SAM family heme chaperone HemW [Woeseia sp.]